MMALWQSFVELVHELIPWLDGGVATVLIILIKGVALILPLIIMMPKWWLFLILPITMLLQKK